MAKVITLSRIGGRRNLRVNPLDCPTCHNPENKHEDFYWGQHGNKVNGECKKCLKQKRLTPSPPTAMYNEAEFKKIMLL